MGKINNNNNDNDESNSGNIIIETVKVNGERQPIIDKTIDVFVPTKTSDLINDSEFINSAMLNKELDNKVNKVEGKGLSSNDYTDSEKSKLANISDKANENIIEKISVNGKDQSISNKTVDIIIPTKTSELINDNQYVNLVMLNEAQSYKVDKIEGKGLSSNDFTNEDKEKINNIPTKTSQLTNDSGYITAIRYKNVLVPSSTFVEDNTFEEYPYKAYIAIENVTENDYANISFALSDVQSKNYAPICTTSENTITIYAIEIPLVDITIPLIEVIKV